MHLKKFIKNNEQAFFYLNIQTKCFENLLIICMKLLILLKISNFQFEIQTELPNLSIFYLLKFNLNILKIDFFSIDIFLENYSLYDEFSNLIVEIIEKIIENPSKKFTLLINICLEENQKILLDKNNKKNINKVMNFINSLINGCDLGSFIEIKTISHLINKWRNNETYGHLNTAHLHFLLSQKIITNLKFVINCPNLNFRKR